MLKGIIQCAKEHDLKVDHPLAESLSDVTDLESVVPLKNLSNLIETIIADNNQPNFTLLFGKWMVGRDISLIGFICENCDTLEDSFAMTLRSSAMGRKENPVLGNATFSKIEQDDDVQIHIEYHVSEFEKYGSEMVIARIVSSIRHTVRDDFPFSKILFKHPQQASILDYQSVFNCPVVFDAPSNAMVFPKASLKEKVNSAQPYATKILREYAESLLQQSSHKKDLITQVKEQIIHFMPLGELTIKHVCDQLAMSESSMRRKLREENTSFSQLVESLRKGLAKKFLLEGQSVTTVTFLLGFSDTSVFNRAFKRWFMVTPSAFVNKAKYD